MAISSETATLPQQSHLNLPENSLGTSRRLLHFRISGSSDDYIPAYIYLLPSDISWYDNNKNAILTELCELVKLNIEKLDGKNFSAAAESLVRVNGDVITIAFAVEEWNSPYSVVRRSSSDAEMFRGCPLRNVILNPLWIFPVDPMDRTKALPISL